MNHFQYSVQLHIMKNLIKHGFKKSGICIFCIGVHVDVVASLLLSFAYLSSLWLPCGCRRGGPPVGPYLPFPKEEGPSQEQREQASFQWDLPETQVISRCVSLARTQGEDTVLPLNKIRVLERRAQGWGKLLTLSAPKEGTYAFSEGAFTLKELIVIELRFSLDPSFTCFPSGLCHFYLSQ